MRPNQWYQVIHPKTGKDYWPADGRVWRFQRSVMERHVADGNIIWPEAEPGKRLKRPRFKTRYEPEAERKGSIPVSTWIDSKVADGAESDAEEQFIVAGLNQEATKELRDLLGGQILEYPKPVSLISALVRLASADADLVLDFFAGSGTTAQAVMEVNREDGNRRRFVMVQLPEPIDHASTAGRSGFRTVSEVGKQRIRRVIETLREDRDQELGLEGEDLGFAVFRLEESRLREWAPPDGADAEGYVRSLELFRDPVKADAVAREVIYEIALKEAGYGLTCRIEQVSDLRTNVVYRVTDRDRGLHFHISLDEKLDPATPRALGLHGGGDLFVCRDVALDDTLAANLALQCRLKSV
jgi:adenine-specific DNA-methyltransferase